MMKEWGKRFVGKFENYVNSFSDLSDKQKRNFEIKKDHSYRVADIALQLSEKLDFTGEQKQVAYLSGLFHDIGRFKQLKEFDTFNDAKSLDHGDLAIEIIKKENFFEGFEPDLQNQIHIAIKNHNKLKIEEGLAETELIFAQLLRDADKLDILKVLSEYYTNKNSLANHTLTWELPKGKTISENVIKEVLAGKLVSKKNISSDLDVRIMQLSWVYDINFRPSVEYLLDKRYLEMIYNTLPKNDTVIEIYRKIKVLAENRILNN